MNKKQVKQIDEGHCKWKSPKEKAIKWFCETVVGEYIYSSEEARKDYEVSLDIAISEAKQQTANSIKTWLINNGIFDWKFEKKFDKRFKIK